MDLALNTPSPPHKVLKIRTERYDTMLRRWHALVDITVKGRPWKHARRIVAVKIGFGMGSG